MTQPESQTVKTGPYETFVNTMGADNDEAVLFVHGSGPGASAWSNWQFALPALSRRYYCVAPDLLGFAKSTHPDPPPERYRPLDGALGPAARRVTRRFGD